MHTDLTQGAPPRKSLGHTVRLASLIVGVVLVTAAGGVAYLTESRVGAYRNWVLHTYGVKEQIQTVRATLNELRSSCLLYWMNRDPKEKNHFDDQNAQLDRTSTALMQMTADNPDQQERLAKLMPIVAQQVDRLKQITQAPARLPSESQEMAETLGDVSASKIQIAILLNSLETAEDRLLAERLNRWNVLYERNLITLIILFTASILLLVFNFRMLLNELATRREREELDRQNLGSYRALSARILELQDIERRRIARELHDSVGQFLTGMKLNLGQLRRRGASESLENPALLNDTLDLADRAITEVRTISHLLHPPLLDELGFESAARWYVEGFAKRSGMHVVIEIAEIVERLPKEIELALFRVLQEALTNVHRHAHAENVIVDLKRSDKDVTLTIQDDGRGIPADTLQAFNDGLAGGIGLAGMRERLAELSGTLEVQSEKSGTMVRATLPTVLCHSGDTSSISVFNVGD
ncbi:MAG: ATP-binding protein [Candidatus Acidiferrum sp.]